MRDSAYPSMRFPLFFRREIEEIEKIGARRLAVGDNDVALGGKPSKASADLLAETRRREVFKEQGPNVVYRGNPGRPLPIGDAPIRAVDHVVVRKRGKNSPLNPE